MVRKGFWCVSAGFCAMSLALCYGAKPSALLLAVCLVFGLGGFIFVRKKGILFSALVFLGGALSVFCFLVAGRPEQAILQTAQSPGRYGAQALDYSREGKYGQVAKVRLLTPEAPMVMVYLPHGAELAPGDLIFGSFTFTVPENTGSFPAQRYYRSKGIWLTAKVRQAAISKADGIAFSFWPAYVRRQAEQQTDRLFGKEAVILKALLFGDRREFEPSFQSDVSVTGMAHIFAVSGMHLSFLVSAVMLLGRRRKWVCIPAVFLMVAMMAVTGFPPSIVRAGIMQGIALLAFVLGREEDSFTALLFALCLLILMNPWSIGDAGLQFSFLSVLGLLTVGKKLSEWLNQKVRPKGKAPTWAWRTFSSAFSSTVSAQAATVPLVVLYFGQISLVAVLANLLILWCVSAVFLGAILALLLSAVWLPAGALLAVFVSWGGAYIRFVISLMAKLPLAVFGAGGKLFSVWVFLAYGLGAVAYSISLKKAWRLVLLLFVLLLPALIGDAWVMRESVSVWALDMGSGQSIIFSSGGKTVVVDCGSQNLSASDEVLAHFRRYNLRAIDALVLTHLDLDHASGAEELLQKGLVKTLYMPRFQKNKELAQRLHITAQQAGTSVFRLSADERASVGNIRIHLFLPPGGSGGNASSLAVMAESRGASVLILGDINDKSDEYMAKTRDLPTVSVLVAGHHGAKTATSQTILEKTSPKYVIISVGRNSFGHPAPETLDRIEAVGAEVRRTDINGTIFYRFYKGRVYER